jgi:tetratricopeptide (TPR) repeat protein
LPEAISPAPENGFVASIREAANTVADAFTLEPKVVPAYDPISLAGQPRQVGSDLHIQAARVYEAQGNMVAAADHYRRALADQPNDPQLLAGLARLHDRSGDYAQAQATYARAVQLDPQNPRFLNDLAMCHARNGASETSAGLLERAVKLAPDRVRYRNNLAAVLVQLGRYEAAYNHLKSVHGEAVAHYNLGYLLTQGDQNALAQQHFARALQIDPNLVSARKMLNKVQAASWGPSGSRSSTPPAGTTEQHPRDHRFTPASSANVRAFPPI